MKKLLYCLLALLVMGCKENYDSPVHSPVTGYLVVEGVVNSGTGPANITLSRTTKLDNRSIVYETGATVKLEGQDNSVYTFADKGQGQYSTNNLNLNTTVKYRLHISVKAGREYLSDFATVKNNPPIDSISWKRENGDGLQLYINTHDPQNNTRYYQWAYDETWQIQSSYNSALKYKITPHSPVNIYSVVFRDSSTFSFDPNIINCWQYNSSSALLLGSTAKLSKDIVYLPLVFVPHGSIKLGVLYSINVKQYAWTKEGYEFLERMKKNTESTGSIFDAQPSELKGNIHCVADSSEPVIGYFNICPAQEKRIFIKNSELSLWGYQANCYSIEIKNISDTILTQGLGLMPTIVATETPFGNIATFYAAPPECVDCTLRGSNKKPAYWP
jgi:Domain of unknown function (DUF4249)